MPINIEGEPRTVEPARNPSGNSERDLDRDSGRNAEREAAIRQILEEFLT